MLFPVFPLKVFRKKKKRKKKKKKKKQKKQKKQHLGSTPQMSHMYMKPEAISKIDLQNSCWLL